jgi:hypothetical protein
MLSEDIIHSCYWYFTRSWNQACILHWKWMLMFVTVALVPVNYKHRECTTHAVNLTAADRNILFNDAVNCTVGRSMTGLVWSSVCVRNHPLALWEKRCRLCAQTHRRTHVCTNTQMYTCVQTHTYTCAHTQTYTCVQTHTRTHVCTNTDIHMCVQTHRRTYEGLKRNNGDRDCTTSQGMRNSLSM